MTVFPRYSRFLRPRIVKTANTKTANNEGRLYIAVELNHIGLRKQNIGSNTFSNFTGTEIAQSLFYTITFDTTYSVIT